MDIAIIGAGNVGRALASSFLRAGHGVVLAAADPEHAREAADELGAKAAASNGQASSPQRWWSSTVPYGTAADIVRECGDAVDGKTVIDVTNPLRA